MGSGAVGHIVIDAHGEGIGLLKHHTHFLPQVVYVLTFGKDVLALEGDLAGDFYLGNQIVHPVQGLQEGGLAAAGRPDKGGNAVFRDVHVDILQCLKLAVPKAQILGGNNIAHRLLLFAKYLPTTVAARLIITVSTIKMAAMAKATPNSPCSFA